MWRNGANDEAKYKWGAAGRVVNSYLSLPLAVPLLERNWKRYL